MMRTGFFGTEYGLAGRWSWPQAAFLSVFGTADVASRIRAMRIKAACRSLPFDRALDFGCGLGLYSCWLSRDPSREVLGYDVDDAQLSTAAELASKLGRPNLTFTGGDEQAFWAAHAAGTFDLILAIEVLTCVDDPAQTLRNVRRCLVPGGTVIGHVDPATMGQFDRHRLDEGALRQLLDDSGLEVVRCHPSFSRTARRLTHWYHAGPGPAALRGPMLPFVLLAAAIADALSESTEGLLFVARAGRTAS